jgi:hypothetical protein
MWCVPRPSFWGTRNRTDAGDGGGQGISRAQDKNKIIVKVYNEKQKIAVTESDMYISHKKRRLILSE